MPDDVSHLEGRFSAMEEQVAALSRQLRTLEARAEISDTILRFNRGLDRLDRDLMRSTFHPDATVDYGKLFTGPIGDFIDFAMEFQRKDIPVQHLVGNMLIEQQGESVAVVETYELARHPASHGTEGDMILATRLLDRFERREGAWKISSRIKVADWVRVHEGANTMFGGLPLELARRDASDASYSLFSARK